LLTPVLTLGPGRSIGDIMWAFEVMIKNIQ
jgi:hypothetical protein